MLENAEIVLVLRWVLFVLGELVWGFGWAWYLDTDEGKWLARCRTWITVVIGDGIAFALALLVVPPLWLGISVLGLALASIGIIRRSLQQERRVDEVLGSGR
jgi:hypothetical protein